MDNICWLEHLQQWQKFLQERSLSASNIGEQAKLARQLKALERIRFGAVQNPRMLMEFINPQIRIFPDTSNLKFILSLNQSQQNAVSLALSDASLSLIQGPPGTGKTQVIAEICLQLFQNNPNIKILVCSETHIAVNNLITRLSKYSDSIRIVRIRDKEQDECSDMYSPESIIMEYTNWLTHNLECNDLAQIISEELSNYQDRSLEKALTLSSNIAGMTCNRVGAYDYDTSSEVFDVAIIDEVCKATLPEILMPLAVARKAILVGDPKQLPPVFCSEELDIIHSIENCHLQKYMYIDQLFTDSHCVTLLDTQYRMAERIGTLVGTLFYSRNLINGRTCCDPGEILWLNYNPSKSWPIEIENTDHPQVFNLDECTLIASLIQEVDNASSSNTSVAVITPYKSQSYHLKRMIYGLNLKYIDIKIDTVDGFQGKECDIVIFSLTRTHGSFRFLADYRRLNVALSRARNKIYMVGYLKYARKNPLLDSIAKSCNIQTIPLEL